jgi:hypothetical protein
LNTHDVYTIYIQFFSKYWYSMNTIKYQVGPPLTTTHGGTHGGHLRAATPGDGHERKRNKIAIAVRAPHGHMENKENGR